MRFIDLTAQKFGKLTVENLCSKRNGKTYWNCVCECGNKKAINADSLRNGGTRSCGCWSRKNITNEKYGKLKALRYEYSKDGFTYWYCRCDCGNTKIVRANDLKNNHVKSCGCLWYTGINEISGSHINRIKQNAKQRKIKYDISNEEIWDKYIKQNKQCALSGLSIYFNKSTKLSTASLDRICSNKDYVIDNVQWVHKDINKIKYSLSINELLHWVYLIVNNDLNKTYEKTYIKIEQRRHYYQGCGNLSMDKYSDYKRKAIDRNIPFNLNIKDCWDIFLNQNGRCQLTGITLSLHPKYKNDKNLPITASLDRIDPNSGYDMTNVRWIHKTVNRMKWDIENQQFINYCHIINNYNTKK